KQWSCSGESVSFDPAADTKNVGRLNFGVELYIIAATMPDVARLAQKIVHLISVTLHRAKLIDWNLDKRMLLMVRFEIHHNQNDIVARRGHFPVTQNCVVVGAIETLY